MRFNTRPDGRGPPLLLLFLCACVASALWWIWTALVWQHRQQGGGTAGTADARPPLPDAHAWDTALQLRRLRADLDAEAARPLVPKELLSLSTTFEWWADIGLGARPTQWGPVSSQLQLFPSVPPAAPDIAHSRKEAPGEPYVPLMWHETVGNLKGAKELNATAVAAQPGKRLMLAADMFFMDGCVTLISTPECGWALDWRNMTIAFHGGWAEGVCTGGPGGAPLACPAERSAIKPSGPLPVMRVRSRTVNEWNVIVDFCSQHLADKEVVDVEFHAWGVSKRAQLARVDAARRPHEEVAMAVLAVNSLSPLPLWVAYWRALGVGRFYLYVNSKLSEFSAEDAAIAAQLTADPGVTVIEWDMPFAQEGGLAMAPNLDRCTGHYAQVMAFNHAYERVRRRHLYMGFFDPDEYGLLDPTLLQAAWRLGANPLLVLLGRYGFPPALVLPNRFGGVLPPLGGGAPVALADAAGRRWVARPAAERPRGKAWVRTAGAREDAHIGNHNVFEMVERWEHPRWGTVYMGGHGYETRNLRLAAYAEPEHASFLHVLNGGAHVSDLGFDRAGEVARMDAAGEAAPAAALTLQRALAACGAAAGGGAGRAGC